MCKLSIANLLIARRWLVLVIASMGLYLVLSDRGAAQSITLGTLKGTYVGAFSLTFNGSPFVAAVRETYFGDGTASGVTTFTVPGGGVVKLTFTGTYTVNADGSVDETDIQNTTPPNPCIWKSTLR